MKQPFMNRELVDMRLLTSFTRVAQLGSVSRAADELGYAPSAVSQHISTLERRLGGATLFTRKPGSRLVLTAAGRALAESAAELLSAAVLFGDVARKITEGEAVTFRVGAYGTALSYLLPTTLSMLPEGPIRTLVETVEIEPVDGVPLLDTGELDILIAHRYLPEDRPPAGHNTHARVLGEEPLLVVTALRPEPCRVADLNDAMWVAGSRRDVDRQLLDRWAGQLGFRPRVSHETRDCLTAVELICGGLAEAGMLPASVVHAPQNRERLTIADCPGTAFPTREVSTITRPGFETPAGTALLEGLSAAFGRLSQ